MDRLYECHWMCCQALRPIFSSVPRPTVAVQTEWGYFETRGVNFETRGVIFKPAILGGKLTPFRTVVGLVPNSWGGNNSL